LRLNFDFAHQLLLTNRHRLPPLVLSGAAVLSCRCTEKPANCILSMSSVSHNSVKHKILQFLMSRWKDSLERSSSSLFSNDCTLANRTDGRGGLLTRLRILTRHPGPASPVLVPPCVELSYDKFLLFGIHYHCNI
jgi:hypothetical protein